MIKKKKPGMIEEKKFSEYLKQYEGLIINKNIKSYLKNNKIQIGDIIKKVEQVGTTKTGDNEKKPDIIIKNSP